MTVVLRLLRILAPAFLPLALSAQQPTPATPSTPDMDAALTASVNFLGDLHQAIGSLLNHTTPSMMLVGSALLLILGIRNLAIVTAKVVGQQVASYHPHLQLAAYFILFLRFAIAATMLSFYVVPIPVAGLTLAQIMPYCAQLLTNLIVLDDIKALLKELNLIQHMPLPGPFHIFDALEYFRITTVVAVIELAMMAVTAVSFLLVGACIFVGPLFVPFYVDFQFDSLFWDWAKDLTTYSMYQVFGAVFASIFAGLLLRFFHNDMHDRYTPGAFIGVGLYLLVVTVCFVLAMWQVPAFANRRFGGFGAVGQELSTSLQRFVVSRVFR